MFFTLIIDSFHSCMLDYRCCVSGNGFEVVKLNLPPNRYWECIVLDSLPLRGLILLH